MKHSKVFNLKPFLYLFLVGIFFSFSAFSCEVFAPLEVRIENKTGYDLKNIRISRLDISSLKNGETSKYVSLEEFRYLQSVYATVHQKFDRTLSSPSKEIWYGRECGNDDYYLKPSNQPNSLESGKHTFVITLNKEGNDEALSFDKK